MNTNQMNAADKLPLQYNPNNETPQPQAGRSETPQVILPDEPPQFTPAAARALIRLLITLHRQRSGPGGSTTAHEEAP